jgi:2-keto-4-pentenoate hydratase/2-oxohepta-3-ene-1,7-dioic acid hydratase in catechol pathway
MKLAIIKREGTSFPALIVGDGDGSVATDYVDIGKHLPEAPSSMIEIIMQWPALAKSIAGLGELPPDDRVAPEQLAAPITRPGKIFAIGLNYADHCEETGQPLPEKQIWFSKASSAINPPFAPIEIPAVSDTLDYEAELVAVIGKTCRNVPAARWKEVVFGYCVGNDVSVREWQVETPQWTLGKSFDSTAPIGPWITTADAVDPHALDLRSYVSGELRQNSNTRHLVFKLGDMIAKLSAAMTLEPGDLIFTGTTGGVGMMWNGSPHYLKPGDRSRIEIEGLGVIEAEVELGTDRIVLGAG